MRYIRLEFSTCSPEMCVLIIRERFIKITLRSYRKTHTSYDTRFVSNYSRFIVVSYFNCKNRSNRFSSLKETLNLKPFYVYMYIYCRRGIQLRDMYNGDVTRTFKLERICVCSPTTCIVIHYIHRKRGERDRQHTISYLIAFEDAVRSSNCCVVETDP